jgi:two-component system, chemotaxis family, sensor kinase CheA
VVEGNPTDAARFDALLDEFISECDEHLNAAREGILRLESSIERGVDRAVVDELFRNFHTIKGLAGMVGLREAELLAHQMESYLDALRQSRVELTTSAIDALAAGVAALEGVVAARYAGENPADIADLLAQLAALAHPQSAAKPALPHTQVPLDSDRQALIAASLQAGQTVWLFKFAPSPALAERGVNVNVVRQRLRDVGQLIHAAPQVLPSGDIEFTFIVSSQADRSTFEAWTGDGLSYSRYDDSPANSQAAPVEPSEIRSAAAPAPVSSHAIRVDLAKLDDVMRMVGELVITRARFEEHLKQVKKTVPAQQWRVLQETNFAFERQIRDLREGVVRVRLVPIREMFTRMQFVVRDLARDCGKEVVLHLSGHDTEVDKLVVERMMDPLLHLVRNAISHGIELPAERVSVGKPEAASIHLRAFASGETIVIEIEDDGRGINVPDVARRARAAGLFAAETEFDDISLLDTICLPHFSTRDQADRASGRGVGMAIVKTAVEQLGGSLSLKTQAGQGTQFRIQLPLTLAIADALIVRVSGQRFAVPQSAVREVMPLVSADVTVLENNEVVSHRGSVLPLVRLSRLFHWVADPNAHPCALIVGEGTKAVGIVVDHVLGLHEVVVRPLTDPLVRVPGISGATELGDGQVVLILDAVGSVRMARRKIDERRLSGIASVSVSVSELN